MSDTFDHEGDAYDSMMDMLERDDEYPFYTPSYRPRVTSCTRCGASNLQWEDGEMISPQGRVHKCPAVQASADDFEVLP